jgi:hypothetical protein
MKHTIVFALFDICHSLSSLCEHKTEQGARTFRTEFTLDKLNVKSAIGLYIQEYKGCRVKCVFVCENFFRLLFFVQQEFDCKSIIWFCWCFLGDIRVFVVFVISVGTKVKMLNFVNCTKQMNSGRVSRPVWFYSWMSQNEIIITVSHLR